LLKPKLARVLAKRSRRLLGINLKGLTILSCPQVSAKKPTLPSFSHYLESFTLFSLHKKIPQVNIPVGFFLTGGLLSSLKKKIFKKSS